MMYQARAARIHCSPIVDSSARYGGEEFVLILPETNLEGGLAVAEKLRLA
jgi:PleD family two-component response regulator